MLTRVAASVAEDMSEVCGVPRLYIVRNAPLEQLLFSRNVVGVEFRHICLDASRLMYGHLADDLGDELASELLILSKGIVYQLAAAAALDALRKLPTNLIATSRAVSGKDANIDVSYTRFD